MGHLKASGLQQTLRLHSLTMALVANGTIMLAVNTRKVCCSGYMGRSVSKAPSNRATSLTPVLELHSTIKEHIGALYILPVAFSLFETWPC